MFWLIKKVLIVLLSNIVNGSNHAKCVSLRNQKCMTQPTLINLHPKEYSQEFHYYPFVVKLDRCAGSCNTLNDLFNKVCVPNKTEDLNLSVFNMITGINESKTLKRHISCKCKCRFDEVQINGRITINVDVSIKRHVCEKDYIWNPSTCSCENGKYLASIMDDSVITCDEIIDAEAKSNDQETKTIPTNFNEKNITYQIKNFYRLLAFLLITTALLMAVSIYCYLIKY